MKKKIAVFYPLRLADPFVGGLQTMTIDMAEALTGLGHEVTIVAPEASKSFAVSLGHTSVSGLPVTTLRSIRPRFILLHTLPLGGRCDEYLKRFDAIVAVCGSPVSALPFLGGRRPLFVWTAALMRQDLAGRLESFGLVKKCAYALSLPFIYRQERSVIRRATHLWALSAPTMRHIKEAVQGSTPSVSVLFPPLDTGYFSPAGRPAAPHLIFAGRYNDARKNIALLLDAFSRVLRRIPEARLTLVGEEAPSERVRRIIRDRGLSGAVTALPAVPREALVDHYRSARIFVIPSRQEGLCIAALEAMACGIPVVSTRCEGPESYIEDGKNGYLVATDDAEEMGERIVRILSDDPLRETLSRNARASAVALCGRERFQELVAERIGRG